MRRQARTKEEARADLEAFEATRAVLRGGPRQVLDESGWKTLHLLLDRPFVSAYGCDATISSEGFCVRFPWNVGPHAYQLALAPPVVGLVSSRWEPRPFFFQHQLAEGDAVRGVDDPGEHHRFLHVEILEGLKVRAGSRPSRNGSARTTPGLKWFARESHRAIFIVSPAEPGS